jgi:TonB family protein
MQHDQIDGAPLVCANDNDGTAICFNPMIRLPAYAQMFSRTIMYDQWTPIGFHTVPTSIRIFSGKKLIVEATGKLEEVKKFPDGFMKIPDTPSQPEPQKLYKVVKYKPMDTPEALYGNIAVKVSVDDKGHVSRESVVDSDDKHLDGLARKFARGLVFEPHMQNGQAVPFDVVIYTEYYPY